MVEDGRLDVDECIVAALTLHGPQGLPRAASMAISGHALTATSAI
jgi:hypothetical protein